MMDRTPETLTEFWKVKVNGLEVSMLAPVDEPITEEAAAKLYCDFLDWTLWAHCRQRTTGTYKVIAQRVQTRWAIVSVHKSKGEKENGNP